MWDYVFQASAVITLIGFANALIGIVRSRRLYRAKALIEAAPQEDRARLVEKALKSRGVETANLTRQQRFELATKELERQHERNRLLAGLALVVTLVAGLVAGLALWRSGADTSPEGYRVLIHVLRPDGSPAAGSELNSSLGGELLRTPYGWELRVPRSNVPADRRLRLRASVPDAFLEGETALELPTEGSAVSVQIELKRREIVVSWHLVDLRGRGIAGARAYFEGYSAEGAVTDASGRFTLPAHAAEGQRVRLLIELEDDIVVDEWVTATRRGLVFRVEGEG